jgi:hypothetical protein
MCANATNFIHFWVASDQVGLRVHRSRALAKFFTSFYSIQHLRTLPTIHAQRRLRRLVAAPPITGNQSPARPDRATSSSLPVRLRPAVPPARRPDNPSSLAWTRPLPDGSARRLHSDEPCHTVSHNTPYTLWKFLELENFRKFLQKKTGNVSTGENDGIYQKLRRPLSGGITRRLQEASTAYASPTVPTPTPPCCSPHFSGTLSMRDGDNVPHKLPRVGNAASMEFNLANAPVTTSSMLPPPSATTPTPAEPHMWGSLMALSDDVDGVVLAARVKQLLTSITMTAFVRVSPNSDQVPPFEPRFARQAVVTFLQEYLTADDLTSVVLGTIKSGAARPITLAEYPVSDGQLYAVDFNLNLASAVNSQFIKNMLANLDATLNSPLSPDQQHLWFKFVPEDASHSFSLLLMPSIRADQSGLIAFSPLTPAQVRKDVCQFLQVPNLKQLPVAVYARATGTEIISLEPELLARVIKGVSHLGTPANPGANYTLCKPIRELPAVATNRSRSAVNSPSQVANTSPGNQVDMDPNPPYLPDDQFNPMPRAAMRPPADPFLPGPHRALTFRPPRGSPGDIITTVALFLAAFFRSWLATDAAETTYDYWMTRILVKLRMNKPIRVVIAVTYGRLFAGVYEALQGTVLERLDRYTPIVLSAGLCLSTICLGGTFCNKCGKPGQAEEERGSSSAPHRKGLPAVSSHSPQRAYLPLPLMW